MTLQAAATARLKTDPSNLAQRMFIAHKNLWCIF